MTVLDRTSDRCPRPEVASSGHSEAAGAAAPGSRGESRGRSRGQARLPPTALLLLLASAVGAGVGWGLGGVAARGLPDLSLGARLAALVVAWLLVLGLWALLTHSRRRAVVVDAAAVELAAAAPLLAHLEAPGDLTLLPALDPGSTQASTFEPLRRAVERQIGVPRPLLAVVAGRGDDEAPVWVGANVAIALAQGGRRVLLVDARPVVATTVSEAPDVPGLAGLLAGTPVAEAVTPGPVAGLDVLPPGVGDDASRARRPPEPDAMDLLAPGIAPSLTAATGGYEVVVVVGPPLRPGPGPLRAGRPAASEATPDSGTDPTENTRGVLVLTVPQGRVGAVEVRRQVERVHRHGTRLLGVVLVGRGPRRR